MDQKYNEDTLVQQTTANYLHDELGWDSVYAYNTEVLGQNGTLGRTSEKQVVLTRYLKEALEKFNPELPSSAYQDAISQIIDYSVIQSVLQTNQDKYRMLKEGVQVQFRNDKGELIKKRLKIFDFDNPKENHFLAVRELWIKGSIYRRRPDIIGFVNGIPLLFVELKNVHKDIRKAYEENFSDYKDTVPHLFHHNAIVMIGNGIQSKIGSYSSKYEYFHEWKRLEEEDEGSVDMETMLKGICSKDNFMDIFENFILFDESSGKLSKIIAKNHQYLGVNRAINSVRNRKQLEGKLGVFWHTQGAGKSYSMAFFTQKIHRKLGGNFTFLVCTDRADLDNQIYNTFAGCGLADNDREHCRPNNGDELQKMLSEHKAIVFTLIQKFNKKIDDDPYSTREDIIVLSDEAHRTQSGLLARNMRDALPNASFLGFTGTPLFKDDELTKRIFGGYVSTYDFQRAVEDDATVPLYYDARGDRLGITTNDMNERIAEKLEELEIDDVDVTQKLEKELKREYHIITAEKRLDQIARDFTNHYSTQWECGKAMLICIDKITCVRMHNLIAHYWKEKIVELEKELSTIQDEQEEIQLQNKINWMKETLMAVIVSEEQGEVDKFRKWDLDITPHRKLIKEGFETADGKRIDVDSAFKKEEHPFRISIVCAMWLTGFDVPSLSMLYLDKPLKAHTLMQAIARANRVNEGKNNGLIIDYCGILKNLRSALAAFAGHKGGTMIDGEPEPQVDPANPTDKLLDDLANSIEIVREYLLSYDFRLEKVIEETDFKQLHAIDEAKEIINRNDETRKRFEIMARDVFRKFKFCLSEKRINDYRQSYEAINVIYKMLQRSREEADITDIIKELHQIIDESVEPTENEVGESRTAYDISKIDFDLLRKEFETCKKKNTAVHDMKEVIEQRLQRMMKQNPLRMNFQNRYEKIVSDYNNEKDRVTIEQTFEELLKLAENLDDESKRYIREGLDEESLAIFDLLIKPDISKEDIKKIKATATELLLYLKSEKLNIDNWREKEATRDSIKTEIKNWLWEDTRGLPSSYSDAEVDMKAEAVYNHIFRVYDSSNPSVYAPA
ncbi:type I restriction endonuclease subunit R [Methanohalophilus profundi]|uniref:type I restriction endonuclease subunit R n=1 Tax=Methanohalophilus profundi TaxID=2138083 RepID=UPI00101D7730|nr:type I restriction endonuclease subunit R [Methanohalophilus profundi]